MLVRIVFMAALGSLCFPPLMATGQTPASSAPALDSQEEKPSDYEVTVTATRTPTPLRQLGQAVTLIGADEIEAMGARNVAQVLESVPGFNVVRSGTRGSVTSLFVRGGESDFNLVLIDGAQINQPGGAYDFADLTTTNVERIEIVRGPASVLYGADAASSVINIITRRGESSPSGHLNFEAGSFSTHSTDGSVAGSSERIAYSLGWLISRSDGFHDFNNDYDQGALSAHFDFRLDNTSTISSQARHLESEYRFPTDFTGALVDPNDFRRNNESTFSTSYQNQISDRFGTRLQYGFYRREMTDFTVFDGVADFFDSTFEAADSRNTLDWQNNLRIDRHNLLTGGVTWEREQADLSDLNRRSVGFYLQDQFSWADRFFVTGGIRFDNNNRFENFTTAKVSLALLMSDQVKLRGSFGNGFRAPSFFEIVGFPDFGIAGNPNLKPEQNLAADVGIDFTQRNRVGGASATFFANRFSDLIEFTFLAGPGSPNYLNIEQARSTGLELEGFVSPTEGLRLGGHYALTDTEVTDSGSIPGGNFEEGEALLRRPRHAGGVFTELLRGRYKLRLDVRLKGSREDIRFFPDFSSARVVLPSYWRADLGATIPLFSVTDGWGRIALLLRGENIFDQEYTEIAGFDSPGRSFYGGLQFGF